jgi:hypothetical protein
VAQNPFEIFGREFRRAMEEHGDLLHEQMNRIRGELESAMERMRDEMERVGVEIQRAMDEFHQEHFHSDPLDRPMKQARAARPRRKEKAVVKKRRPRRKPPGAATAPVKPKPKPTPLKDGAEAPVE